MRCAAAVALLCVACAPWGVGAFRHIGCYIDGPTPDLDGDFEPLPSPPECELFCRTHAIGSPYQYFAVYNNSICRCGNSYGQHGVSMTCQTCASDPMLFCGSADSSSVYALLGGPSLGHDTPAPMSTPGPETSPPSQAPVTQGPPLAPPATFAPGPSLAPTPVTVAPPTQEPPTPVPPTAVPVFPTVAPVTPVPQTPSPPTEVPPTSAPTTPMPPTPAPPTVSPPTSAPPTAAPQTSVPPSPAPPTLPPTTQAPLTVAPPTPAPPTVAPPTQAPLTVAPPTAVPPTVAPMTPVPRTPIPPTAVPPTPAPPTASPPTAAPATPVPPTPAPPTLVPDTPIPPTAAPPTLPPATPLPMTPTPLTPAPLTTTPQTTFAPLPPPPSPPLPTPLPPTPAPLTPSPPATTLHAFPPNSAAPPTPTPATTPAPAASGSLTEASPSATSTAAPGGTKPPPTPRYVSAGPAPQEPSSVDSPLPPVGGEVAASHLLDIEEHGEMNAAVATIGGAAAGGFAAGTALRLALVSTSCTAGLPLALHPTQIRIDGSDAVGLIVANVGATALFCCLCFALLELLHCHGNRIAPRFFGALDAQGFLRIPSAPLFLFQFCYQGVTLAAMTLLLHGGKGWHVALGAVTIAGCIAIPCAVLRTITRDVRKYAVYARATSRRNPFLIALIGSGEWVNTTRHTMWVQRYVSVIRPYKQNGVIFIGFEFTASMALSAIKSTHPESTTGCAYMKMACFIVFASLFALEIYTWPHARQRDAAMDVVMQGMQGASMLLSAIGLYVGNVSHWTLGAAEILLSGAFVGLLCKLGLDLAAEGYIMVSRRRSMLQADVLRTLHPDEEEVPGVLPAPREAEWSDIDVLSTDTEGSDDETAGGSSGSSIVDPLAVPLKPHGSCSSLLRGDSAGSLRKFSSTYTSLLRNDSLGSLRKQGSAGSMGYSRPSLPNLGSSNSLHSLLASSHAAVQGPVGASPFRLPRCPSPQSRTYSSADLVGVVSGKREGSSPADHSSSGATHAGSSHQGGAHRGRGRRRLSYTDSMRGPRATWVPQATAAGGVGPQTPVPHRTTSPPRQRV